MCDFLADPDAVEEIMVGRVLNVARGAYWSQLGNTPGHLNHWSRRSFIQLLGDHGEIVEVRSPFPWTMLLVRV